MFNTNYSNYKVPVYACALFPFDVAHCSLQRFYHTTPHKQYKLLQVIFYCACLNQFYNT